MVLMDAEGNRRKSLRCRLKEVSQKHVVGVLPGALARLDDDGTVRFCRRTHDGQQRFEIGHVESRHSVAVVSGVVENLPQRGQSHVWWSLLLKVGD